MNRILLFFITSIFLSAAYSTDAQEYDWALKAVEAERAVYLAEDPDAANDALIAKAFCYRQAGMFSDASSTLGRVRMYLLSPDRQDAVLLEQALCHCLAGDPEAAVSVLEPRAAHDTELSQALAALRVEFDSAHKYKKEGTAVALAFLPPLGMWYTKHYGEGMKSFVSNAAAAGWTVWQCLGGCWISGLLGGGLALNHTFMGGIDSSAQYVGEYNDTVRREWNEALKNMLLDFSSAGLVQ